MKSASNTFSFEPKLPGTMNTRAVGKVVHGMVQPQITLKEFG